MTAVRDNDATLRELRSLSDEPKTRGWASLAFGLATRAVFRPVLALDLLSLVWAFRRREWYRQPPFLPLPDSDYMRWRMYTAYGDENAVPPLDDVVRFARWRRDLLRL
jgi:hypothetical protein